MALPDILKDENKSGGGSSSAHPYASNKSSILLETRQFNQTAIKHKKCLCTLTKILHYMQTEGGTFTPKEQSALFFSVTRLFQAEDLNLRRMVYLIIKLLISGSDEAFIVTSSLTKDMNTGSSLHRANAIRVLSKILDGSTALQLERFLKTAIIDKCPFVSSAVLVCGLTHVRTYPDVIRRWVNEIAEVIKSKNIMVQFHAISLLCELKRWDRLSLQKTIQTLAKTPLKSALAECVVMRFAKFLIISGVDVDFSQFLTDYLENQLRHRSDIVVLEAVRTLTDIAVHNVKNSNTRADQITSSLQATSTALQIMLSSSSSVSRFAAMRILIKLGQHFPTLVAQCSCEVENLLTDSNRCIASLALINLLKNCSEQDVEKLIKQVTTLNQDIPDSLKSQVLQSVKQLVLMYPSQHNVIMVFLANLPRDDGPYEIKREAIESLIEVIETVPEAKESGLLHLCEFIEDAEYSSLCIKALNLIGKLAPETSCPSKYIRYIYNRLILESASVRAASAGALLRVSKACPELSNDIALLLESCLVDNDSEIRERFRLYHLVLQSQSEKSPVKVSLDDIIVYEPPLCLEAFLERLKDAVYAKDSKSVNYDEVLNISTLPTKEEFVSKKQAELLLLQEQEAQKISKKEEIKSQDLSMDALERCISTSLPQMSDDAYHHSNKPQMLTEKEAEYPVKCIKHIYTSKRIVFEFQVSNTMAKQTLKKINFVAENYSSKEWNVVFASEIATLKYESTKSCFVVFECKSEQLDELQNSMIDFQMVFLIEESEYDMPYDDKVGVEPVLVSFLDYISPFVIRTGKFKSQWSALKEAGEATVKLSLNYKTVTDAVNGLIDLLNLAPCDNTEQVSSNSTHELLLAGRMLDDEFIACRCMIIIHADHGCLLKAVCRSPSSKLSQKLLSIFDCPS